MTEDSNINMAKRNAFKPLKGADTHKEKRLEDRVTKTAIPEAGTNVIKQTRFEILPRKWYKGFLVDNTLKNTAKYLDTIIKSAEKEFECNTYIEILDIDTDKHGGIKCEDDLKKMLKNHPRENTFNTAIKVKVGNAYDDDLFEIRYTQVDNPKATPFAYLKELRTVPFIGLIGLAIVHFKTTESPIVKDIGYTIMGATTLISSFYYQHKKDDLLKQKYMVDVIPLKSGYTDKEIEKYSGFVKSLKKIK